jgi:hypothetical protein
MENLNFDNDAIIDPKDEAIENLRRQLDEANRRDAFKADQLDQLGDAIMALIGDKATALIESRANDLIEAAMDEFNIRDHEYEIGDMIDERLPEGLDDESRADDLKSAIKEVLAGATLTMDIE